MAADDTDLRDRVERLEARVEGLGQGLLALAAGLECSPGRGLDGDRATQGARLAHELLLSLGLTAAGAAGPDTSGAGTPGQDAPAPR